MANFADPQVTGVVAAGLPSASDPRRRRARGKNRPAEIIAEARRLFIAEGDAGLTVRRVADALGMRVSNLQYYFRTKEDLFAALLADTSERYRRAFDQIADRRELSTLERVTQHLRFLIEDEKDVATDAIYFELWSMAQRHPLAAQVMNEMYASARRRLCVYIAELNPAMLPSEVELRAALVVAQIEGLMIFLGAAMPRNPELAGLEEAAIERTLELVAPFPQV